jgi:hypothetical protein
LSAVLIAFENGGLLKQQKINMVDWWKREEII